MASAKGICEPCFRGEIQCEGFSWCSDCEEILCEICDRAHRFGKLTQSHHLVDLKELPEVPIPTTDIISCDLHQEQAVTSYCTFHDEVCCRSCLVEKHRTCEKIKTLEEVSKDVNSSVSFEDVVQTIPNLLKTLKSIKENRQTNADEIKSQENVLKESISREMTKIRHQVGMVETKLFAELAKMKNDNLERLARDVIQTEKMEEALLKQQSDLDFTIKHGSKTKTFLVTEKMKRELSVQENKVLEMLDAAKTFKMDILMETGKIETTLSSFSALQRSSDECNIKHISIKQKHAQVIPSTVKFGLKHFVTVPPKSAITGIALTARNELLLCDWENDNFLMFDADGTLIAEPRVNGDPYGIAIVPGKNEAVVTLPNSQRFQYFDTENKHFTKSYETNGKYYGIDVVGECLVLGKKYTIVILSMDGRYLRTIPYHNIANIVRFIRRKTDDVIIFTDSKNMHCITLEGTRIFEHSDTTLARGIDIDQYGYMYVAYKEKKIIKRIAPDAKNSCVVLDESDSIGEPLALCFSRDYSRLYVGSNQSKLLAVVSCKWI